MVMENLDLARLLRESTGGAEKQFDSLGIVA
jgi:hypothetical protein